MKKVLHITNRINANSVGGIKTFILELLEYNNGRMDNYFVFNGRPDVIDELHLPSNIKVFVFNFSVLSKKNELSITQLISLIKSVDVIHQHSVWRLNSLFTIIGALFYKKRTIIQPHGAFMPYAFKQKSYINKKLYYHLVEKLNLKLSTSIVVSSNEEAMFFEDTKFMEKTNLIPLGVKSEFLYNRKKTPENNKIIFSFISRIHPIKGLDNLVDAISMIDDSIKRKLIIYIGGKGNLDYENELKERIISNELESIFIFLGLLNDDNKKELLDKTNFFVLPSFSESFSISIIESLARGVPVLTTTGTPWKEIMPKNECGWICEPTSEDIMETILKVVDIDQKEYLTYSQNAYSLVKDCYLFENNMNKLNHLYIK